MVGCLYSRRYNFTKSNVTLLQIEVHSLRNSRHSVNISVKGAQLLSWTCHSALNGTKWNQKKPVLWVVDDAFWNRVAPVLFPIVGRLKDDQYIHNGNTFEMKQHGFARDAEFECVEQSENSVLFQLNSNKATLEVFPFSCTLQIRYTLTEEELIVEQTVTNTDHSSTMPFSIGAHPGFHTPHKTERYSIQIDGLEEPVRQLIENGIYTGEMEMLKTHSGNHIDLSDALFESDAIVFKQAGISSIRILEGNIPLVKLSVETEAPYWGVWKKPGAPFLCLEPWWGIADNANASGILTEKEGMMHLTPGASQTFSYKMEYLQ